METITTIATAANVTLYEQCYLESRGNDNQLLQCLTSTFEARHATIMGNGTDRILKPWLLVICGALVFVMQAGFAMVCAGSVRKKNVVNTMLKNLLDACAAAIAFYTLGYGLAYGENAEKQAAYESYSMNQHADDVAATASSSSSLPVTFCGNGQFFGHNVTDFGFWFFQYTFSAATVTIVAGTLAERCKMTAYFFYSLYLSGFVYPIVAHAVWSNYGFLSPFAAEPLLGGLGVLDAAGAGVVHLCGGVTALIATIILGPRQGRFHDADGNLLEEPAVIPGHSMALQLLGTLVLWFGWYGFNGGSALLLSDDVDTALVATRAVVNTTMAAATGALTSLAFWALTTGRQGLLAWDLPHAMNGALAGLVSITSGCFVMDYWSSVVTGMLAGLLYVKGCRLLDVLRIDDAVNAVPVHMMSGALGLLATGLFANPDHVEHVYGISGHGGIFFEFGSNAGGFDATLLCNQCVGIVFIAGWAAFTTAPFFWWLNWMGWFRVAKMVEIGGLDAAYHAEERDRLGEAELRMAIEATKETPKDRSRRDSVEASSSHRPKVVHFG